MPFSPFLKNKKVLLVGLGQLGGGVETAKFLLKNKIKLSITDLKNKKDLKKSLNELKNFKIKFILGKHDEGDFKNNDIIIFNPAVSVFSPWAKKAKKYGKEIYNDYTLFLKCLSKYKKPVKFIGITGTRGKTTVAAWTAHFLSPAVLGGNIPGAGLLKTIGKISSSKPLVLELSSYQLEYIDKNRTIIAPHIAVITNFFNDHLNRYGNMAKYGRVKTNIFLNQTENDFLVFNYDDKNSKIFLRKNPKSRPYFFSLKPLPVNKNGLFFTGSKIYMKENKKEKFVAIVKNFSVHQKYNLLAALLAAYLNGKKWKDLKTKINSLPQIHFRQETVLRKKFVLIINDSAATSPDGTIAAIESFKKFKNGLFLITGGTDKNLDFSDLARNIKKFVLPRNLFLLEGNATFKLVSKLNKLNYFEKTPILYGSLDKIVKKASETINKGAIVFSPASASFEKFKNEFDRGKIFNKLAKKYFK